MIDEQTDQRGYRVTGRVQGVGFRWWTQRTALGLELSGSVCNRPDGSVELHARGTVEALEELSRLLWEGPWGARVHTVKLMDSGLPVGGDGFSIVPGGIGG